MRNATVPLEGRPRAWVGAALALCGLALQGGCDQLDLKSPAQRIATARQDLAARNPKAAEIELKNALQKEPKNIQARLLMAEVYLAMHRGQSAEVEIGHAEQFGASPASTLLLRARTYVVERQFPRVLKEVPAVVTGSPSQQADLLEVRGDAQTALGLAKEAEASYDGALGLRPDSLDALFGKARAVAQQGRLDDATQLIDRALAADPKSTKYLLLKGEILQKQQKPDEAIALYRTAAKNAPDDQTAQITLGTALIFTKQLDAAKEQLDIILKKWPQDPKAQYLLSVMHYNRGDYKAAFDAVQKVTSADPDFGPAIALTASIQYALGSYLPAESNARRFTAIYPTSIYGRKLLSVILVHEGQFAKALEALAPILAAPQLDDPQIFAIAGSAAAAVGDTTHASQYLARAAELDPKNAALRRAYGVESLASGNPDAAVGAFQSVVDLDRDGVETNSLLVLSHAGKKDFAKAIAMTEALIDKHPREAAYYNLLGGVYLAKGDPDHARPSFEKAGELRPEWAPPAINLAKLDVLAKRPDDGKKRLMTVAAKDRKNLDVLYLLSDIDASQGRFDESRQWLESAAKENPDATGPRARLIGMLIASGESQQAVGVARDIATRKPDDREALRLLGLAQASAGQRDAAVATYGRLAGLMPDAAWVHVAIARLEAEDGHVVAAQSALSKALALAPDSPDAQISAAELAVRIGRFDEAATLASQLEKHPETVAVARMLQGDIAMGRRRPDLGLKAYQDAFARLNSATALIKVHAALSSANRKQEANDRMAAWMTQNPRDVDSRIYFAGYAEVGGDTRTAKRYFDEALALDPKNPIALNEMAIMAAADKDPKALDYAERAYAQRPGQRRDRRHARLVARGERPRRPGATDPRKGGRARPDQHRHAVPPRRRAGQGRRQGCRPVAAPARAALDRYQPAEERRPEAARRTVVNAGPPCRIVARARARRSSGRQPCREFLQRRRKATVVTI